VLATAMGHSGELYDQLASSSKTVKPICTGSVKNVRTQCLPAKNDKIVTMIGDLQWKFDGLEMMSNAAELEQKL